MPNKVIVKPKQFLAYGKQSIDDDDIQAVVSVLKSDWLTQGPTLKNFEQALCDYTGAKYCVCVSNGTAALHLAVQCLEIESNKQGITTPNTFLATSNALIYNQLQPIFADIDPLDYNISPEEIKNKINKDTKLIIPVHFAGQPAKMSEIKQIADQNNCFVIEDAAHAIGSQYKNGQKVGSCCYSDLTTFSFHPVKTMTTGEGGAITTNNKALYEKLLMLRSHGVTKSPNLLTQNPGPWYYEMQALGWNYRMTDIQAALGLSQLKKLDQFIKRRREIVQLYNIAFQSIPNISIPNERQGIFSAFHLYVIQINFQAIKKSRAQVMDVLKEQGVGTQVHYIPVHMQPYYQQYHPTEPGTLAVAEQYYEKALSVPLFPQMHDNDVNYVINCMKSVTQ